MLWKESVLEPASEELSNAWQYFKTGNLHFPQYFCQLFPLNQEFHGGIQYSRAGAGHPGALLNNTVMISSLLTNTHLMCPAWQSETTPFSPFSTLDFRHLHLLPCAGSDDHYDVVAADIADVIAIVSLTRDFSLDTTLPQKESRI